MTEPKGISFPFRFAPAGGVTKEEGISKQTGRTLNWGLVLDKGEYVTKEVSTLIISM